MIIRKYISCVNLLAASAGILILVMGPSGQGNEKKTRLDDKLENVLKLESRTEAGAAYAKLFEKIDLKQLLVLPEDKYSGIAMRAAWEKVMRSVPKRTHDPDFEVDRTRLFRFLGFCEGRLRTPLPRWWEETVLSAKGSGQEEIGFTLPKQCTYIGNENESGIPKNAKLTVNSTSAILSIGKEEVVLPKSVLDYAKRNRGVGRLTPIFDKDVAIVAAHLDLCSPFYITCIDRKTNKKKWEAYVLTTGTGWGFDGAMPNPWGNHFVSLAISDSRVIVFGAGPYEIYVEAFAISDGHLLFRFCTGY